MSTAHFDEKHVLNELKHYLASQQALKEFIQHPSLHALPGMKFCDALSQASKVFGLQVHSQLSEYRALYKTGRIREDVLHRVIAARKADFPVWKDRLLYAPYDMISHPRIGRLRRYWKEVYQFDLDNQVQPLLFQVLSIFPDRDMAIDSMTEAKGSFTHAIKELELKGRVSFFRTKFVRQKFLSGNYSITELLMFIVGKAAYFRQYLFDQQLSHPGWSGLISASDDKRQPLFGRMQIRFPELLEFELLLELDVLQAFLGNEWRPLHNDVTEPPLDPLVNIERTEFTEVMALWQETLERSYYDAVLQGSQVTGSSGGLDDRMHDTRQNGVFDNTKSPKVSPSRGDEEGVSFRQWTWVANQQEWQYLCEATSSWSSQHWQETAYRGQDIRKKL